jgi:hypothetical protein
LGRREHPDACDWELIEADHDLELIEAVQVIRVLRHGRAAFPGAVSVRTS